LRSSVSPGEDPLDLLVQFVAVGDDGDASVRVVFQNPLGEQHHDDALAAALGVPDDAALLVADMALRRLDAEILVRARQLLHPAVEQHKVVHEFDQPALVAHLEQILVQLEAAVVRLVLLPLEEILFRRADGAVLQPLGIVAGKDELHRREEPGIKRRLLVREALPDAVADGDAAVLEFQHADGDAVYVKNNIGAPLMVTLERYLLGDGEVVALGVAPVNEVDRLGDPARLDLRGHPVAQEAVNSLIVTIERAVMVVRLGAQLVEGDASLRRSVAGFRQPRCEQTFLDVAVAVAVGPVAKVAIMKLVDEQGDDAFLRGTLGLADGIHDQSLLLDRAK
jgi:hypothetical protein